MIDKFSIDYLKKVREKVEENIKLTLMFLDKINRLALQTGWFYDIRVYGEEMFKDLIDKDIEKINNTFINFYRKETKNIKNKSIARFPERKKIIEKAFKAHRKGDYEISVILLLTQIDGIFREISNYNIFSKNKDYKAAKWIKDLEKNGQKEFIIANISALKETEILALNFDDALKFPNIVSRNRILHGLDLNFGSYINSLKTISMLNFITWTIYNLINKKTLIDN